MQVEEKVLEKLNALPIEKQLEVLDFAEFLESKSRHSGDRPSLKGALEHLNIDFTEQDLKEARDEMWQGFTRDTE